MTKIIRVLSEIFGSATTNKTASIPSLVHVHLHSATPVATPTPSIVQPVTIAISHVSSQCTINRAKRWSACTA